MNETKKIDELVADYLLLRDEKERLKREFTDQTEDLDAGMKRIEAELHRCLQESGLENFGSKRGTVYKVKKTFANVADWNVLLGYIRETESFDLLTKAVSKEAVVSRIEETGLVVPGVNITKTETVGIRRK